MDLVQILTVFVIAYLEQRYPIKDLKDVLSPTKRAACTALIPELEGALRAYDSGQEFDWGDLAYGVNKFAAAYSKTPGARSTYIKVLKAYAAYYTNSSEKSLQVIEKLTSDMSDDYIRSYFSKEAIAQSDVIKGLAPLVKSLGGAGVQLTLEEAKAAKVADPLKYAQYLALRKEYTASWKVPLSNFVRNSGDETVPLADALSHLKSHGIKADLPTGFLGRIDANGNWYTLQGERIAGGAPSIAMFPSVRMNPAYDDEKAPWIFQAIRTDGKPANYFYTEAFQRSQSQSKFEKVKSFDPEATRKKWLPELNNFDPNYPDPRSVSAVVLEILYRTSNRIGSKPMNDPKSGGFGISTLLCAHFYPQADGSVKFIYSGKDSVKTVAVIKKSDDPIAAKVCKAVYALAEGKRPRDPLFTYMQKNNTFRIVQASTVNALFKECCGVPGLTAHKLRTAAGSRLYRAFLDDLFAKRKNMTPVQVLEMWKKGAVVVGKELNHVRRSAEGAQTVQPLTSLANYIDPDLQAELFLHYGAPFPAQLERLMRHAESEKITASMDVVGDDEFGDMPDEVNMSEEELAEAFEIIVDQPTEDKLVTAASDPMSFVKIAADSIDKLRKSDVFRVLDETPAAQRKKVADFISSKRPDLAEEVKESLADL